MKVLMVNKFLYPNGGSETYIFGLARHLERNGHDVEFFGMQHAGNIVSNRLDSHVGNMEFRSRGLRKILYPVKIIYSLEARKRIGRIIDAYKPDLIHLNNINFQLTPSILYEIKKHGIPVVMTLHDFQIICPNHMLYIEHDGRVCEACKGGRYVSCVKNRCIHRSRIKSLIGALESRLYHSLKTYERRIDLLIAPSRFIAEKMGEFGQKTDKIRILPNFTPESFSGCYEKEPYVLYFGRLEKQKGIPTLIEACRRLPRIRFKFAGTGDLECSLKGIGNVEYLGFVNGEPLRELIGKARLSVYPSEWYENCPLSILESQALGTPVVASDIGGIPELVSHGRDGFLFRPGDAGELADIIESVFDNQELLGELSRNCRQKAGNYRIDRYYESVMEVYREAQALHNHKITGT